jgi:hypothetical protein
MAVTTLHQNFLWQVCSVTNRKNRRNPMNELIEPRHVPIRCKAKTRVTGEPCKKWAMIGKSRCRLHGGASNGRPKVHGRRSAKRIRQTQVMTALAKVLRAERGDEIPVRV